MGVFPLPLYMADNLLDSQFGNTTLPNLPVCQHEKGGSMTDETNIEENRIELSQYDLDHLNQGQPVFKGIGEDTRIVLYSDAPLEAGEDNE